ncbi:MAG: DsbA family protein [Tepidamorphaceae bacterium]
MDRRNLIIGGAAVGAAVAAGGYYFTQMYGNQTKAPGGADGERDYVSPEQLAVAGPLGDMVMGDENAPVTIVEYASMTCGHCADFHKEKLPKIKEEYIDTGKVKLIFREFPFDPVATAAFMVARCADKDRYFPLVSALFELQKTWAFAEKPVEGLQRIALQAGFTQESFNACLQNQAVLDGVNAVKERASKEFGLSSTPTFFINGNIVRGNVPIEEFREKIDSALKS